MLFSNILPAHQAQPAPLFCGERNCGRHRASPQVRGVLVYLSPRAISCAIPAVNETSEHAAIQIFPKQRHRQWLKIRWKKPNWNPKFHTSGPSLPIVPHNIAKTFANLSKSHGFHKIDQNLVAVFIVFSIGFVMLAWKKLPNIQNSHGKFHLHWKFLLTLHSSAQWDKLLLLNPGAIRLLMKELEKRKARNTKRYTNWEPRRRASPNKKTLELSKTIHKKFIEVDQCQK